MADWLSLFQSTLRVSSPLLFVAMGGLLCERSGVIQIGLEGLMMVGGFAAAVTALAFHSVPLALAAALAAGAIPPRQLASGRQLNGPRELRI